MYIIYNCFLVCSCCVCIGDAEISLLRCIRSSFF